MGGRHPDAGNRKRECRAWTIVGLRPQTATMALNDRTTHGQANAHSVTLCGVERVEESLQVAHIEPDTRVLHGQAHSVAVVAGGPDHQLSRTVVDRAHGL